MSAIAAAARAEGLAEAPERQPLPDMPPSAVNTGPRNTPNIIGRLGSVRSSSAA